MYYILVNPRGHYYARLQNPRGSLTTRHIQEAQWFLHRDFCPNGFVIKELHLSVNKLEDNP